MTSINVNDKMEIQKLLESNTIRAGGDFHSDNLDEDIFISDMKKSFKITPIKSEFNSSELLKKIIKSSTVKVRGRFNSRELKQSKFIKSLFENFELERL